MIEVARHRLQLNAAESAQYATPRVQEKCMVNGLIASLRPAVGHGWPHCAWREAVKTTGSAAVHRRGAASLRHADGGSAASLGGSRRFLLFRGFLAGRLEEAQKLAVHGIVTGGDLALGEDAVATVEIADESSGFAHEQYAGGEIPR